MSVIPSAIHTISMEPPLGTSTTQGTWVSNPMPATSAFRTEVIGQWPEWLPPESWAPVFEWSADEPPDDRVDAHQQAWGVDRAYGRDETRYFEASYVRNPVDRASILPRRVTVPTFELASNPTINLNEIRQRRFNLIDHTPPPPAHPIIAAVLRKKLGPKPTLHRDEPPPPAQRLTRWERLRANYALFE